MEDKNKIFEIKPTDKAINEMIIAWLNDKKGEIEQLSVIVVWKDGTDNGATSMRSSMNNQEKVWYWEAHKAGLFKQT